MAEDTPDKKFAFKYLFDVQTRGIKGGFSKVSGISEEIEVVDLRDGSDPFRVRKIKGTHQGGSVTLERGVVKEADELIRWFRDVKKGMPYTANVWVRLMNPDVDQRDTPILSVRLLEGWPNKYEIGDLDAKASEIAVETITIVHEGLEYLGMSPGQREKMAQQRSEEQPMAARQLRPYRGVSGRAH